jgi:hypothetical protein
MKTQLLEDIGQSTTLFLAPSNIAGNPEVANEVLTLAPAGKAQPSRPRYALGVWRHARAAEAQVSTTQQSDQQPPPLDLNNVFEELAALEAQYVPPLRQHEPAMAPAGLQHALPASPAELLHEPAIPPAGPTLGPDPTDTATTPRDPVFDFTLPAPELPAAKNPFTRPPAGATRSRQRYFLWGACLLSCALLVLGGRWLYQERKDDGSFALSANDAKGKSQVDKAVQGPAIAAQASTPGSAGDARLKSTEPAEPAPRPASSVPPLVYLEADPPPPAKAGQPASRVAAQAKPRTAPKPAPAADQGPASPLPKRSPQKARERSEAAARRATAKVERAPARQLARASAVGTGTQSGQDTSKEATLKACREHGYQAAQCIKRACSVTEYGFVCRGR